LQLDCKNIDENNTNTTVKKETQENHKSKKTVNTHKRAKHTNHKTQISVLTENKCCIE